MEVARPREFDEHLVVLQVAELFAKQGFNGTSLDDLVAATGLKRGSIYKAFGSKLKLFQLALQQMAERFSASRRDLDFLTVALKELATEDKTTAKICRQIAENSSTNLPTLLGQNLMTKMKGRR